MKKALYIFAVFAMIVIAVLIRIPQLYEHKEDESAGDQGIQFLVADHTVRYKDFRLDGEISSFDKEAKHIIHNSPIGYYLYTLFYVLGGQSIEGYNKVYFVLNIVQALFLFFFGYFVFGPSGGILMLALSLFSRGGTMLATYPSQPANAVIAESIALGIFGLYVRTRRVIWFWAACLVSLLATQLYSPMYLLIIPKIALFLYIVRRIKPSVTSVLTVGVLGLYVYLPLILQEYIYRGDNLNAMRSFISQSGGKIGLSEIAQRLVINVHILFSAVSESQQTSLLMLVITAFCMVFYRKKVSTRHLFIVGMVLVPTMLLVLHPEKPYIVPRRAYDVVTFPYIWALLVAVASLLHRRMVYGLTIAFIAASIWAYAPRKIVRTLSPAPQYQAVVSSLADDIKRGHIRADAVDLFVISPLDSWSWDAALYWYALEKALGSRLSRIDYNTSKASRISEYPVQTIYLICHRIAPDTVNADCKSVFERERMEASYGSVFKLVYSGQVMDRFYFVYQQ